MRCEFWTWGEGYVRPDCCTEHLLELAVFTHQLLEANGVRHWLDFGSLLGAVRDGAMIPWDSDVDFGCLGEQLEVVKSLGPVIEAAGHSLDLTDSTNVRINYSVTNLQHVDIYPWFERDGRLTTHFDPGLEWPGMSERGPFPARYLEDLETVTLMSHAFPAPSPVHRFLVEHRYGPDYLVPARQVLGARFVPEIGVEELTPAVRALLDEIATRERQFIALKSKPGRSETSFMQRWIDAGLLPLGPDPERLGGRRKIVPAGETGPIVDSLTGSLAVLDQAIDELEHPSARVSAVRTGRRTRRLLRRMAARVRTRNGDEGSDGSAP